MLEILATTAHGITISSSASHTQAARSIYRAIIVTCVVIYRSVLLFLPTPTPYLLHLHVTTWPTTTPTHNAYVTSDTTLVGRLPYLVVAPCILFTDLPLITECNNVEWTHRGLCALHERQLRGRELGPTVPARTTQGQANATLGYFLLR